MSMFKRIIEFSTDRPKIIIAIVLTAVILFGMQFPKIKIDTDPENMLSKDEFSRVYHHEVKEEFGLYDFVVLVWIGKKKFYAYENRVL